MHSRNISRHLETDYGVNLSGARREKLSDFFSSRFDQMLFPEEEQGHGVFNDAAEAEIDKLQLESRQRRDMALDFYNPREQLPKDVQAERTIEQIPDFRPLVIDLSRPEDYKSRAQVQLVQDARANFIQQSNVFDEPGFLPPEVSQGARGIPAADLDSLGAAGLKTDRLHDEDDTVIGVESVQAF